MYGQASEFQPGKTGPAPQDSELPRGGFGQTAIYRPSFRDLSPSVRKSALQTRENRPWNPRGLAARFQRLEPGREFTKGGFSKGGFCSLCVMLSLL